MLRLDKERCASLRIGTGEWLDQDVVIKWISSDKQTFICMSLDTNKFFQIRAQGVKTEEDIGFGYCAVCDRFFYLSHTKTDGDICDGCRSIMYKKTEDTGRVFRYDELYCIDNKYYENFPEGAVLAMDYNGIMRYTLKPVAEINEVDTIL